MKLLSIITVLLINQCSSYEPLLKEINRLYPQNAFVDDINSIAIDQDNENIYVTNTASGTIDIISYSVDNSLTIIRSIDINLQCSEYFKLDYSTSITYTNKGYIVATLIPYNYAKSPGWLVFIDPDTQYIENFIPLRYCYAPKHIVPTSDGNKLVIACEGLADENVADPAGSISVVNIESNDPSNWKIYNVGFTAYDDCDDSYDEELVIKHLPEGIYLPKPEEVFSINAEPEYITIDDDDRFAYISLQENNGLAILAIEKLEISEIYSFGAHDFSYTGLDPSDKDNGINIMTYHNLYGLRQPDGIIFYKSKNGKSYILTANEGNAKYFDTVRVNQVNLDNDAFPDGDILKKDDNLGRLQILNAGQEYGLNDNEEFSKLYAFGSRDWSAWQIEGGLTQECPCKYPYALREVFSSYHDFEQITAQQLDTDGFNKDFFVTSTDQRSDGKGPEPEWYEGERRYKIAECQDFVKFYNIDGGGCSNSEAIDNVDYITCQKWVRNSCEWRVPAPICQYLTAPGDDNADESGLNNQLCKVVMCGNDASFGLKDESCSYSVDFMGIVDDIDGVSCSGINGGYGIIDSCQWNIPTPDCKYTVIDDSSTNNGDGGDGIENNNEKENRSNFDVIINKGGHFYESTMFYILLAIFIITFCGIIICDYKHIVVLFVMLAEGAVIDESKMYGEATYSTCYEQVKCLKTFEYEVLFNPNELRICLYWLPSRFCAKYTPFHRAAAGFDEEDIHYQWESGFGNKICQDVSCGEQVSFQVQDGTCIYSAGFEGTLDSTDGVKCSGGIDGSGMIHACTWTIPSPSCVYYDVGTVDISKLPPSIINDDDEKEQEAKIWYTVVTVIIATICIMIWICCQ